MAASQAEATKLSSTISPKQKKESGGASSSLRGKNLTLKGRISPPCTPIPAKQGLSHCCRQLWRARATFLFDPLCTKYLLVHDHLLKKSSETTNTFEQVHKLLIARS